MRVLIIGAGGHAQVVADIFLEMQKQDPDVQPVGYLDDDVTLMGQSFIGLPVLGTVIQLSTVVHDALIVAVGDNCIRKRLFEQLNGQGRCWLIACHPRATVARDVSIGPGTMICAGAIVNPGSVIGANVILNTGCTVDHHNYIGAYAHIAPGVHLGGDVVVDDGALIGIGATVMPQCRVGAWSIVGAGSLINRDLPDYVVATGMPARIIRRFDKDS